MGHIFITSQEFLFKYNIKYQHSIKNMRDVLVHLHRYEI